MERIRAYSADIVRSSLVPFCRNCGSQVAEETRFCQNCGVSMGGAAAVTSVVGGITVSTLPRKDVGVAVLLAGLVGVFLMGAGHFYVGKVGRGINLIIFA
jgi:hypothetical protein